VWSLPIWPIRSEDRSDRPQRAARASQASTFPDRQTHSPPTPRADVKDERPVQAPAADRGHPPLRVGIRPRCPHRRGAYLDPLGGKHRIERGGELRIPIADQQPQAADTAVEIQQQVAGLLGHHSPTGCDLTRAHAPGGWRQVTALANSQLNAHDRFSGTHRVATGDRRGVGSEPPAGRHGPRWCRRAQLLKGSRRGCARSVAARARRRKTAIQPTLRAGAYSRT